MIKTGNFLFLIGLLLLLILGALGSCQSDKGGKDTSNTDDSNTYEKPTHWEGIYRGTIPCSDCEGIKVEARLYENNTYQLFYLLYGKDDGVQSKGGTTRWLENGTLVLDGVDQSRGLHQLRIKGSIAKVLDPAGKEYTDENATAYILQKEAHEIMDKKWELFYMENSTVKWTSEDPQITNIILPQGSNKLVGMGGCNRLMGSFEITSEVDIQFTQLATTKKMCPDIKNENKFLELLGKVKIYTFKDEILTLYQNPKTPLLKFRYNYF